ncbi:hypothetical protein LOF13_19180 [Klebsiella pneumoniae subsp. pneumoniae]|nr:hypothetical protein LOF13_19180 [Klebsiella pneumoniae subsp. pneumoniae]
MDKAFCTIDEKEWIADAFYALPLAEIQLKRRSLLCTECKGMHGSDDQVTEMTHRIFAPITTKTAHWGLHMRL